MAFERTHVLIVEDEQAHAELTKRAVLKAGHARRVDVVRTGEEALDYLLNRGEYADRGRYGRPGLVFLDIKLPGMSGIELLERIKNDARLLSIPVVMLTTSEQERDIAAAYERHANSYLTKPVGFRQFEDKVEAADFYWMRLNRTPIVAS